MVGSSKKSKKGENKKGLNASAQYFYNPNLQSIINRFFPTHQEVISHQQDQVEALDPPISNDDIQVDESTSSMHTFMSAAGAQTTLAGPSSLVPMNNAELCTTLSLFPTSSAHIMDAVSNSTASTSRCEHSWMQEDNSRSGPSSAAPIQDSMIRMGSRNTLTEVENVLPQKQKAISRLSFSAVVGQDESFTKVRDHLRNDVVGIIGIYGMGGVGKTTLMKKVCNEFLKPTGFVVIWITVSSNVNFNSIQKCIMKELDLSFDHDEGPVERGMKINEKLSQNKDRWIALLLDDIWKAIDLEKIGVSGGLGLDSSKFKLIFTTRSKDVCLQMHPDQVLKMECLNWEESWALFKQNVGFETLNHHKKILHLAVEVAKKCGGLPLALTVIGKAMVCKTSVGAWKHALKNLMNRGSLLSGTDKDLFECLKFSYDNLENQVEKECFLYSCMYSEDEDIEANDLIQSWIGEGFLDLSYSTYEEACNRGRMIIDILIAKSLLEVTKETEVTDDYDFPVKVHDIIRDMGLWIISESRFFKHSSCLELSDEVISKMWNKARRIFVESLLDDLPENLYCPNLSHLWISPVIVFIEEDDNSRIRISNTFLNTISFLSTIKILGLIIVEFECPQIPESTLGLLVHLRHLNIKHSNITALPPDIGNLTKLLHLELSNNDDLATLPLTIVDLCELRSLQIWNLPSCGTIMMSKMVDAGANNEVISPFDMLYKLKKLEYLCISFSWDHDPDHKSFLRGLKDLTFLRSLKVYQWPFSNIDVIFAFQAMHRLGELIMGRCRTINEIVIPECFFLPQLKNFRIFRFSGLERVNFGKKALENLTELNIHDCKLLDQIVGLQHLPHLRQLFITVDIRVESDLHLDQGLLAAGDEYFLLTDDQTASCFTKLECFVLNGMGRIKRVCNDNVAFPSLLVFELCDCPMVKKLPRGLMYDKTVPINGMISGTRRWWERLEWEDDDFKSYLYPLFRAKFTLYAG